MVFESRKKDVLSGVLATGLNIVPLPLSVGSMVQGDWSGFLLTSGLKLGGLAAAFIGAAGANGPRFMVAVGGLSYLAGEIGGLVTPWTFSGDYNKQLKSSLRLDAVPQ